MRHRIHRLSSLIAIAAILFAQLALSAYACTNQATTVATPSDMMSSDCEANMVANGGATSALCHTHCQNDPQIAGDTPSPLASVLLTPSFVATVSVPEIRALQEITLLPALVHATSPPLAIRNCCFRI